MPSPRRLILITDRSDDSASAGAEALRMCGYDVETTTDGQVALDMVRTSRPALIVMSLELRTVSGWEVTRILKSDEATLAIKILVYTGHTDDVSRARAWAAGCDAIVSKPCRLERLVAEIALLLVPPVVPPVVPPAVPPVTLLPNAA